MRDAVVSLAHDRGLAMVVAGERLAGVLTTGDLTRLAERDPDFLARPAVEVMTRTPKTAAPATSPPPRSARWSATASSCCRWSTTEGRSWAWCTCTI